VAKITQLSEHVANMIAAGEVVEGPLSVVKELVENSIDAGATNIAIHLVESGIQRIEIVDDGCGMDEMDATMAFNRHATSKIKSAYDLASINTLGFRGEALPSIASVSLLELITKEHDAPTGIKVTFKAGKLVSKESFATNNGTRIVVSNLFYNTPARLKYLKSPNIILASICELVDKLALSNRNIRFTLTNNNQTLLSTNGIDDVKNLFAMVYGVNIAKNLINSEGEFDGIRVKATYTNPTITRSRKNDITLVVNNRYVKSNIVTNAVCDAFKDYVAPLRYPICLVELDIDSLLIDVNVHPQKMEIKFSTEKEVYNLVKDTIINGIKNITIIPSLEPTKPKDTIIPIDFTSYLNLDNEEEKVELKEVVLEEYKPVEKIEKTAKVEEKKEVKTIEVKEEIKERKKLPYLEYIGQFSGTYLLFQNEEGLFLVDQHAAQERINYEYYYNVLANPTKESIPLLVPIDIELKKEEALILNLNMDKLQNVGFVIEANGINSFFIREIPTWIKLDNSDIMIEKIIYYLLERNVFDVALLRDSLAKQIACKASIKANHYVSKEEVSKLMSDLNLCQNPFNCPHGRPVFVKFTHYEIEKLFKRVV
jgi:DNA mismatch repair protein MutL